MPNHLSVSKHPRLFVVGSANMDLVIRLPRFPHAGETLTGSDLALHPGGKGANQAVAAAKLGADVVFVGCLGNDPFGSQLLESLKSAGVEINRVKRTDRASGCASIYVDDAGENCIVLSPGANADVDDNYVREALKDLTSADFVLLQLEIPFTSVQTGLQLTAEAGAVSILDPAPARPLSAETLHLVRILTPNHNEATTLLDGSGAESIVALSSQLLSRGPGMVILKLGQGGCAIRSAETAIKIKAFPVEAIDTTAAGDIFNAALAVALSEGQSILEAAQFASAAAAISVTRHGAQTSAPTRGEVERFVQDHPMPGPNRLS